MKKLLFLFAAIVLSLNSFSQAGAATASYQTIEIRRLDSVLSKLERVVLHLEEGGTTAATKLQVIANYQPGMAADQSSLPFIDKGVDTLNQNDRVIIAKLNSILTSLGGALGFDLTAFASQNTADLNLINSTFTSGINVGGFTKKVSNPVTTNTVTYNSGDNMGGILTFTNAIRTSSSTGIVNDWHFYSTETQTFTAVIDLWAASPTGTFTNNSAQVLNDPTNWLGSFSVGASDWVTTGTVATASLKGLSISVYAATGTNIFGTIKLTSAVAYTASTTGGYSKIGIMQD